MGDRKYLPVTYLSHSAWREHKSRSCNDRSKDGARSCYRRVHLTLVPSRTPNLFPSHQRFRVLLKHHPSSFSPPSKGPPRLRKKDNNQKLVVFKSAFPHLSIKVTSRVAFIARSSHARDAISPLTSPFSPSLPCSRLRTERRYGNAVRRH